MDDLDQLQKLFRYVDIESSDWCRALRLVKLIFMSDLHCFCRRGPVNHDQDEAVGSQGPRACRGRQGFSGPVLVGGGGKRGVRNSCHDHLGQH